MSKRKNCKNIGSQVILKKKYGILEKNTILVVISPDKKGKLYRITVQDARGRIYLIPNKYLSSI